MLETEEENVRVQLCGSQPAYCSRRESLLNAYAPGVKKNRLCYSISSYAAVFAETILYI